MLEKALQRFGLRDEEIKSFLFLVENGPQSAGAIARKTGLSRPSLYGFMRKLQGAGLVIESQKNGVKTFLACSKEKVANLIDEKIQTLQSEKLLIEKVYNDAGKNGGIINPKFQLFEGKDGVRSILGDMLLYHDIETKAYWPIQAMLDILSEDFFKNLNKERIRLKLKTRAIWPRKQIVNIKEHPYLGAGEKFFREIRIAPQEINFSMGYWIYGNKVAFISSKREAFGFIIESRELAETLSSQFEVIWKLSKPIRSKPEDVAPFFAELP